MQLKSLEIHRNASWEKNPGQFSGTIKTESPEGEVTIRLNPEHCREILAVIAEGAMATAKEAADMLTNSFIEETAQPLLAEAV